LQITIPVRRTVSLARTRNPPADTFCWINSDVEGVHPYPEHRTSNATRHAHIFLIFPAILRTWWWFVFISRRYKYVNCVSHNAGSEICAFYDLILNKGQFAV